MDGQMDRLTDRQMDRVGCGRVHATKNLGNFVIFWLLHHQIPEFSVQILSSSVLKLVD